MKTLSATRACRTGQKFGEMKTDDHSIAMQGIVGVAQPGVDQSFGSLTTTKSSRAFQGQMDAGSFSNLFSKLEHHHHHH
uniref:Podospora anserina S mat+ genomic DNA chromosome 3, supercontig 2 n=1 Tax=Podospora anserina (strain S / ATCC MYA-4624 / DSM 980 / FGSC 10383) TaxID=515849 RepID=UPI000EA7F121|nr:Chain A, Podospora anserina S mat+ genomic DNA chromosome 3, supercontig 2 [Podospora anserina S mat+]6EKA_B Chain B, Podospora anserina S mat+ genomic DNA chromosome 3, supercontig 2 [Podospora anserina S mat+]6EKA_C Chain C, Podospora anserina S mat+ genomic DNA chromosome 3, supercontig 2 [Podospora anserina S mat+]6EKA_D Chain D, Podospora anserina S mat+ genomic DNA chromosome 3, supercontig 2 [Podospora anserina S mat+]6EKA_E Chain E, Podospora anserina S mat+ genomic DNA chromosome 3,